MDIYDLWSTINIQVFFGFCRKLARAQNPNKSQTKRANLTGVQYLREYHQVVSTSPFILYPLLILLPQYLRQLPFLPPHLSPTEYRIPSARSVIRNSKTASLPNTDNYLATTETIHQPSRFRRCIFRCAYRRLR